MIDINAKMNDILELHDKDYKKSSYNVANKQHLLQQTPIIHFLTANKKLENLSDKWEIIF